MTKEAMTVAKLSSAAGQQRSRCLFGHLSVIVVDRQLTPVSSSVSCAAAPRQDRSSLGRVDRVTYGACTLPIYATVKIA